MPTSPRRPAVAATLQRSDDCALLALQGPEAAAVLARTPSRRRRPRFHDLRRRSPGEGGKLVVSRSGYTGEDGFEISVPADLAEAVWNRLLAG